MTEPSLFFTGTMKILCNFLSFAFVLLTLSPSSSAPFWSLPLERELPGDEEKAMAKRKKYIRFFVFGNTTATHPYPLKKTKQLRERTRGERGQKCHGMLTIQLIYPYLHRLICLSLYVHIPIYVSLYLPIYSRPDVSIQDTLPGFNLLSSLRMKERRISENSSLSHRRRVQPEPCSSAPFCPALL